MAADRRSAGRRIHRRVAEMILFDGQIRTAGPLARAIEETIRVARTGPSTGRAFRDIHDAVTEQGDAGDEENQDRGDTG